MILELVFCLLMCFGSVDESITAKSAAESYQWVLWRQRYERSTAECQKALTGRGAAGNSRQTWSVTVASGLPWLRLLLIASWQPQEMHPDVFAASCCLGPWSQHTWEHPKDENLHTPASKITVPFPAKYKKLIKWVLGLNHKPQTQAHVWNGPRLQSIYVSSKTDFDCR